MEAVTPAGSTNVTACDFPTSNTKWGRGSVLLRTRYPTPTSFLDVVLDEDVNAFIYTYL